MIRRDSNESRLFLYYCTRGGARELYQSRTTHERWDADEKSLDEMVELLREALSFSGRTHGRQRILELGLSNEQVAQRIIAIYQDVTKKED